MADYPAAVTDTANLPSPGDDLQVSTTLTIAIASGTGAPLTATVVDNSAFPSAGYFVVGDTGDLEVMRYTSKPSSTQFAVAERSVGTPAATDHDIGDVCGIGPVAVIEDRLIGEVIAIETELGVDPAGGSATVVLRLDGLDTADGLRGLKAGDTWTGVHDFGGATSFELPNGAAPTVNADGEIAIDTTVADFSLGVAKFFGGEEQGIVSMPIAEFTTPTDGHLVAYNAANDEFELVAAAGGASISAGDSNVTVTDAGTGDVSTTVDGDLVFTALNGGDVVSAQQGIFYSAERVTPANNDEAYLSFFNDGTGGQKEGARFTWRIIDVDTEASRDNSIIFSVVTGNTLNEELVLMGDTLAASSANSWALNMADTSRTAPVLCPDRSFLTTGYGGSTDGSTLDLIFDSQTVFSALDSGDVASAATGEWHGPTRTGGSADDDEAYVSFFLDVDDGQEEMARLAWIATDVTTGTADGGFIFLTRAGDAAVAETLRLTSGQIGFFGAAAVSQQSDPGNAVGTDAAVINAIHTALQNLGLLA